MVEQPHFDDELTILTAQQVVPLTKVRTRKRWFLGGAFAVAMLLGAASAIVSAYFKFRNTPEPEIQPAAVLSVPEPTPESNLETVKVTVRRPKPTVRNTDNTDVIAIQPPLSQDENTALKQIRDSVLTEEWQERRARRVGRIDRRDRRNLQHRDRNLSNIDEIFEGPHHP